jgi:hypothetical protein
MLVTYGLGKLDPAEQDAVARHLSDCAAARGEYKELTAVFEKMRSTPDGEPIPPEMLFLDGPPDRPGDAPLRGALAQLASEISARHGVATDAVPDHGTPNNRHPNDGLANNGGPHDAAPHDGVPNSGVVRGGTLHGVDPDAVRNGAGTGYRWMSGGSPGGELHHPSRPAQLAVVNGARPEPDAPPSHGQPGPAVHALGAPVRRRREVTILAAAAALVLALLGAGWVGRVSGPDVVLAAPTPLPAPPAAAAGPPGRLLVASNGDGSDAVAASAVLTPADGWVGVAATVSGIPAGQQCALVVLTRDGAVVPAASWVVGSSPGPGGPPTIRGSVAVPAGQITAIVVREHDAAGRDLVSIPAV